MNYEPELEHLETEQAALLTAIARAVEVTCHRLQPDERAALVARIRDEVGESYFSQVDFAREAIREAESKALARQVRRQGGWGV